MGALLLHRLPQRAAEIPRGVLGQPDQLGARRGDVRQSRRLTARLYRKGPRIARPFSVLESTAGARYGMLTSVRSRNQDCAETKPLIFLLLARGLRSCTM